MIYPHVLNVMQSLPSVKLGTVRCIVRADSGVRSNGNQFFNEGTSGWIVLLPISALATFRLAADGGFGEKYNFEFALPKDIHGNLIYTNPFHREISNPNSANPVLEIVEYAASAQGIRIVLESDKNDKLLGEPVA